jgi:hypothetical protein
VTLKIVAAIEFLDSFAKFGCLVHLIWGTRGI